MTSDLSAPPAAGSTTTAGRGKRPRPPFGVSAVSILAVLIALFSLVPLGYVVYMTAATGWDTAVELIFRPRVGELLLNTILLMVITVPLCIFLGVGGAWLVERTTAARPKDLGGPAGGAPGHSGLCEQLRLGVGGAVPGGSGLGRPDRHALLLPAGVHPGGGHAQPPGPCHRTVRRRAGARQLAASSSGWSFPNCASP